MTPADPLSELAETLGRRGLRVRGGFAVDSATDAEVLRVAPWARTIVLIGNVGSELWARSGADIAALGDPDPLDRWTRGVIEPVATSLDGVALYPFAGPPYWPFQRWAERAEGVRQSPIGIQIHAEFGLWHAYRAAILLRDSIAPQRVDREHPCDTCADRPCLSRCPVKAFSPAGYNVDGCITHVVAVQNDARTCSDVGCLARLACPIGAAWRYHPEHARFHMRAFVKARMRSKRKPPLTNAADDVVRRKP